MSAGETVPEQFELDADLERSAIARLRDAVKLAFDLGDHGSRELFEHILVGEESHLDWLETQQRLLAELGEAHYLAQQLHE